MPKPRKSSFEEPYVAIIDRLIARRHELEMTQADLGAAYGEDQSFISRVERRQRRIDVYEFVLMCRALELNSATLLGEIEERFPSAARPKG
jgi:transcriptional regulator with XRE-family HTH domain